MTDIRMTFDPGLTMEQVEQLFGAEWVRMTEMVMTDQAVEGNPLTVRSLMARHLGYNELADRLQQLAEKVAAMRTASDAIDDAPPAANPRSPFSKDETTQQVSQ